MAFSADSLGLQPAAMTLLRDLVHERLGIVFEANRFDLLADRLAPLVSARGFTSYLDYYYFLKYDPASGDEWMQVADAISVPETYFWREVDQLHAIVNHIVPALVRAGRVPVNIWSIPCASGEEPLTLAMLLEESGWFDRAPIEIHAADASPAALARAKQGEYRERAFRVMPPEYRARYFCAHGNSWRICPKTHARVQTWQRMNLRDPQDAATVATGDIVLCRNLFIYFSEQAIREVVEVLGRGMPAPGYLCVGASESLLRVSKRFDLQEIGGAFVYVKPGADTEAS
jgi:chemotaxis protein methyltransferase CheR